LFLHLSPHQITLHCIQVFDKIMIIAVEGG